MSQDCGGCEGKGAHRRWCPASVGHSASVFGQAAEEAEALGDRVGSNEMGAANLLYSASGRLRTLALARRDEWRAMSRLDRYLEPPEPFECAHQEEHESQEECDEAERIRWEDEQTERADARRKGEE